MNAIHIYRIGRWCHLRSVPLIPRLCRYVIFFLYNSDIFAQTAIGRRSRFAHGGIGVVIHQDAVLGDDVMIGPHVVIGGNFKPGVPVIGNNVWIAAGAKILGAIQVGSNVVIGANAVVLRDVPDNVVVAGIPARIVRSLEEDSLSAIKKELSLQET